METDINIAKTTAFNVPNLWQIPFRPEAARKAPMLFQCEVMFGSPSSNCGGNGICKIVAKSSQSQAFVKRTSCSHAQGLFTALDNGNGASLIFRRDWLCANLMRKHFRHGILEMPEPCAIPPQYVTALGLKITEMPAGLHLIEDYGSHFRINFYHNPS